MTSESANTGLASSMTDLMTSLAVIFILLLVATWHNERQRGAAIRKEVREALKQELNTYEKMGLRVEDDPLDPLGLLVIVNEGLLRFDFNSDQVPREGVDFLGDFIPIMGHTLCGDQYAGAIESVVIEGHTDSVGTDAYNLKLSQDRSMAVARIAFARLNEASPELAAVKDCFMHLISANGRGEMDPLRDSAGREDAARSRRVVFKIRVKSSEQRLLEEKLQRPEALPSGLRL